MYKSIKTIFINNKWSESSNHDTINVLAPGNGQSIGAISRNDKTEIDLAVAAERQAFEGIWGNTAAVDRGRLLSKLGLKLTEYAEELA